MDLKNRPIFLGLIREDGELGFEMAMQLAHDELLKFFNLKRDMTREQVLEAIKDC